MLNRRLFAHSRTRSLGVNLQKGSEAAMRQIRRCVSLFECVLTVRIASYHSYKYDAAERMIVCIRVHARANARQIRR